MQDILTRPDLPAFSENIQRILQAAGSEESSVQQITSILMREYSVSLKLLRTANSPLYNRSGKPILSVAHAASLMGLQAIRDLAAGMLLFEHFRDRSPGVRELMMLSLLTANHAREAAKSLGYPRPEEAYLCGMFRNLGEVLIACYYIADYQKILVERKQNRLSERQAGRKVLKFTYEGLGRGMVEQWSLPAPVRDTLREFRPGPTRLQIQNKDIRPAITAFSHLLTDSIYRADPVSNSKAKLNAHREAFRGCLGISSQTLQNILDASIVETRDTFAVLNIPLDSLRLKKQLEESLTFSPAAEETEKDEFFELRSQIRSDSFEWNAVMHKVLEEIQQSGPFDRSIFAMTDPESNSIQGRFGVGQEVDALSKAFRFPLEARGGPISVALLRRQDLFRFGQGTSIPGPFQEALGASNFALCPIVVQNVILGCLFCDRKNPAALTSKAQQKIMTLRDLATEAIGRARGNN